MDPPKIAGLPADASGISQIGSVLGPAIRELVMGDPREAPRRIKPESARARERRRARSVMGVNSDGRRIAMEVFASVLLVTISLLVADAKGKQSGRFDGDSHLELT